MIQPPTFTADFREQFRQLLAWRRDVRRFRRDPVDPAMLAELLELACYAPSVGNSQPWRFVIVDDSSRRSAVIASFERSNLAAAATYTGERAAAYARLKLEGLQEAPCHVAVFADEATDAGLGLGRRTMPETLQYSAVAAVHTLWLAARVRGIGVGWVSILERGEVSRALDVPAHWDLIAYLCVGYPDEEHLDPELERHGWQAKLPVSSFIVQR